MTVSSTVLIAGVGHLGSRYLQGLRAASSPLSVVVCDPAITSLKIAQRRWERASPAADHRQPVFVQSLTEAVAWLGSGIDIAIVSTSAGPRREVVESIARAVPVRYWVLEKLLAQSPGDIRAIVDAIESPTRAFVNTPRRTVDGYATLRQELVPPLDVRVDGGRWGLASNAIHMIDTVEWLAGDIMSDIAISGRSNGWYATKRPGHLDMTGCMTVEFARASRLVMAAHEREARFTVSVTDGLGSRWAIDQNSGVALCQEGDSTGQELEVLLELQSTMTPRIVEDLLSMGTCGLPTLEESARVHIPLLDELLNHWNSSTGASDTHVPIT